MRSGTLNIPIIYIYFLLLCWVKVWCNVLDGTTFTQEAKKQNVCGGEEKFHMGNEMEPSNLIKPKAALPYLTLMNISKPSIA